METAIDRLDKMQPRKPTLQTREEKSEKRSEDSIFCELLCKILESLPNDVEKELLKLNIQQKVVELRVQNARKQNFGAY